MTALERLYFGLGELVFAGLDDFEGGEEEQGGEGEGEGDRRPRHGVGDEGRGVSYCA